MKTKFIWKILIYFIIYSIIGFFIETVYAIFTKGMLESRQSFLYGPFCIVYGIAAICLIFSLSKYKNKNIKLFLYGMIIGGAIEYFSSYISEIILHVKWWDYSNDFFNINGRTCLYYILMWGFLSLLLINYVNPFLDKIINKIIEKFPIKILKTCTIAIILFMFFDGLISCFALDSFLIRVANEYNINIKGIDYKENALGKVFSNEKMMMTYPNIIVVNEKDEPIYLESVLTDVKNYYYKFGVK